MKYYPHILCGLLLIVVMFQCRNDTEQDKIIAVAEAQHEIDQKAIDSLGTKITVLEVNNKDLESKITSINSELKLTKERIVIIQKEKDEKINSVDDLIFSELQQFFTSRYGKVK